MKVARWVLFELGRLLRVRGGRRGRGGAEQARDFLCVVSGCIARTHAARPEKDGEVTLCAYPWVCHVVLVDGKEAFF